MNEITTAYGTFPVELVDELAFPGELPAYGATVEDIVTIEGRAALVRRWASREQIERRNKIASGQIVEGKGRYWFEELRWSDQAWNILQAGRRK